MRRMILGGILALSLMLCRDAGAVSMMYTYQPLSDMAAAGTLPTLKAMNIDVVMNYYYTDNDSSTTSALALLDAYQSAGLKGMIRLGPSYTQKVMGSGDYAALTTFVNALKNHPALYGWYAYDEPPSSYPVPQLATVYDTIKAADPSHPVMIVYEGYGSCWGSTCPGVAYPYSTTTHDIFGIDTYPIGTGGGYSRTFSYPQTLDGFTSMIGASWNNIAVSRRDSLFFVLQTYGSPAYDTGMPSAQQVTEMAAAAGNVGWTTKGIAFWMWEWYGDSATTLSQRPGVHAAVSNIAAAYHENLYGTTGTTRLSMKRGTSRIQITRGGQRVVVKR